MLKTTKTIASVLAIAAALGGAPASAADDDAGIVQQNRAQVEGAVNDQVAEQVDDKRGRLISEAVSALDETETAIAALKDGRKDDAIDALARATGKLETIVARSPDLALAPVDVTYLTIDLIADVDTIKDIGNRVEDLVEDGEFQAARAMLRNFASEIVVTTTSLPLATYPDAILKAAALIDEDKTDEALEVLNTALSTQVVTEKIIPLAPLRAEAMIAAAAKLLNSEQPAADEAAAADDAAAADGDAKKAEAPTARDYVAAARYELRVGEALGYGTEDDFEDIYKALDELDEKIEATEDAGGVLDKIADRFKKLKSRLFDGSNKS